jgi:hypothetical protein
MNLLACAGARPASACADSGATPGDATVADGVAPEASLPDADDAALPEAAPPEDGSSWQTPDASVGVSTIYTDAGVPVPCLAIATQDLVADPARSLLYASVPSTSPQFGNSVIRIDPVALTVTGTVFAGSDPNALAITDDGAALYLGEDGVASVRRVDLASGNVQAPIALGMAMYGFGPLTAREIRAVPGSDTRFVVSRRAALVSPSFQGIALYDGANLLGTWTGFVGGESIAFASPTALYGYDNEDTGFDLYEFTVTATGFQVVVDNKGVFSGFNVEIAGQGGWIFATDGQAVNAASNQLAGRYPASGPVWADPAEAKVWFLDESLPAIRGFDRNSFLLERSIPLPASLVPYAASATLVGWPTGLAFRTPGSVCIVPIAP